MKPPPAEGLAPRLFLGPALRAQPDRRLVKLVREGYETAFEEIVRRYGRPLGRYASAIVGRRAEDVTQDAFSKALLALRRDDREIELRPWLYRIVRNTALNDLRDRPPASLDLEQALETGSLSAAEEAERREEVAELMARLRALPEPQRAAIVMRELEGLSHEEIAAALGLSGGAARQAIYRARQALRDGLGMMIPLPLVRTLIEHGTEAGVAGAGGAAVAAALKIGIATVLIAGSVGAGVALDGHVSRHGHAPAPTRGEESSSIVGSSGETERATSLSPSSSGGASPSVGSGEGSGGGGSGDGTGLGEGRAEQPAGEESQSEGPGPAQEPDHQGSPEGHGGSGPGPGGRGGDQEPTQSGGSGQGPHGGGGDGSGGSGSDGQHGDDSGGGPPPGAPPPEQGSDGSGDGPSEGSGQGSSGDSGSSGSGSSGPGPGSGSGSHSGPGSGSDSSSPDHPDDGDGRALSPESP